MRYPTIPRSLTDSLVHQFLRGESPPLSASVVWSGSGDDVELGHLTLTVQQLEEMFSEFRKSNPKAKPEEFEGIAAGPLHQCLRDFPVAALDDPGFWRYVSLAMLWWFISVREEKAISRGNHMNYVDGLRPAECVPLRMFLRAQSIQDGDDYGLAASMPRAGDFWRSHIVRVRTGSAPPIARGFARLQSQVKMPTDDLRPFARRVNRLWTNVVLDRLDDVEASEVMQELYESREEQDDTAVAPAPSPTDEDLL